MEVRRAEKRSAFRRKIAYAMMVHHAQMANGGRRFAFPPYEFYSELGIWRIMVHTTEVPRDSEISRHLAGAHFFDAYALPVDASDRSALEVYIDVVAKTPAWINFLMAARNRAVSMLGLKNLGHLDNIGAANKSGPYRVGDRVGIFSILFISEREVILADFDKHLDAKVSVFKTFDGHKDAVVVSTVVHIHNIMGRVYMLFVVPFHKIIVPFLLACS